MVFGIVMDKGADLSEDSDGDFHADLALGVRVGLTVSESRDLKSPCRSMKDSDGLRGASRFPQRSWSRHKKVR